MKLLKLTATFGCLNGETLEFSEGFTLIGAPNGSGKSTWCAFLRTMLYGLDTRQRDRKGAPADKNRYRPWSGAPMEGLMLCRYQGKLLEVRRTSADGIPMGTFSAIDPETGQTVPGLTGENLGQTLTGVSRAVFDRSVFLPQTGLAVLPSQELEKRISCLVSTGEEVVSWSEADERLRSWQRRRRYHKSGLLPQLEAEEAELAQTLAQTSELRQELSQLQSKATSLRRQKEHWDNRLSIETDKFQTVSQQRYAEAAAELDAAELRCQTLKSQMESHSAEEHDPEEIGEDLAEIRDDLRSRHRMMTALIVIVALLSVAAAAFHFLPQYILPVMPDFPLKLPELPLILIAVVVGGLWLLVLFFAILKAVHDRQDRKEQTTLKAKRENIAQAIAARNKAWTEAQAQRAQAQKYFDAVRQQSGGPYLPPEAEACRESLHNTEQEIARLQGRLSALGDPVLVDARLDNVREEIQLLQTDYDALDVALEALQEADRQLHARFSPQLSDLAGRYFAQLTRNQYTQVSITRSLDLTVRAPGEISDRPLSYLSQGTADQLYLALRLAVSDLVLPDPQACPLILDDALLSFDDQRLRLALDCLTNLSRTRQVVLFTCQHREFELLRGRNDVHMVTLPDF